MHLIVSVITGHLFRNMSYMCTTQSLKVITPEMAGGWLPSLAGECLQNMTHIKISGVGMCV